MDISKETETLKTQTEQKMNLKCPIIQLEVSEEAVKAEWIKQIGPQDLKKK